MCFCLFVWSNTSGTTRALIRAFLALAQKTRSTGGGLIGRFGFQRLHREVGGDMHSRHQNIFCVSWSNSSGNAFVRGSTFVTSTEPGLGKNGM